MLDDQADRRHVEESHGCDQRERAQRLHLGTPPSARQCDRREQERRDAEIARDVLVEGERRVEVDVRLAVAVDRRNRVEQGQVR
jgi:hypothetical protein